MKGKIDIEKVEAALKRAARAAMSGRDEDRNGRFMPRNAATGRLANLEKTKPGQGSKKK